METLIEIDGLTKRFGPITAVDGVSFSVARGEVLGFLGPNGAGKSTTMKMATGFLPPTSGTARIHGFDVVTQPIEVKRRVGYMPEGAPAYGDMTPASFFDFVARIRGAGAAERRERIAGVVDRLELGTVLHRPIEALSKGFKRRVGLAQALLMDPDVLILDEPTDGLDPNQKHEVRTLLAGMAGQKAIIVSTHILEEVDAVCTRAIVIGDGRILADARPQELEAQSSYHNAVGLRLPAASVEATATALRALAGVARVETVSQVDGAAELLALPAGGEDILAAVRDMVSANEIPVSEIYVERGRLDEVFRRLTVGA